MGAFSIYDDAVEVSGPSAHKTGYASSIAVCTVTNINIIKHICGFFKVHAHGLKYCFSNQLYVYSNTHLKSCLPTEKARMLLVQV